MSNFNNDDYHIPLDSKIESYSAIDSKDLEDAIKKVFSNGQNDCDNLLTKELEKEEDERRYYSTETINSHKIQNTLNTSKSVVFNVINQVKKEPKNILRRKRGRKKRSIKKVNLKGNLKNKKINREHDKYDKDNTLSKIQVKYINFIILFLNLILLLFKYNKKERFYLIAHVFKKTINKEYSSYLKTLKLGDIVQMEISEKCTTKDVFHNKNLYNKIKLNPYINNILEENYLSFFRNVYYKSERKINLRKYGINEDIIISDDIIMYSDIINSFENKDYNKIIQCYVNEHYFDNKLFFITEK